MNIDGVETMNIDGVEMFRGTMQGRTPEGECAKVILLRRGEGLNGRVWLTFNGAIKTTVVMTNPETRELVWPYMLGFRSH